MRGATSIRTENRKKRGIPQTGQDGTQLYWLIALAGDALAAGLLVWKKKTMA